MSTKKILLSMLCVIVLGAIPAHANGNEHFGPFKPLFIGLNVDLGDFYGPYRPVIDLYQPQVQTPFSMHENTVAFQFAGQKDEGALRLFVSADSFSPDQADSFAEGLNAISPAAGIQFTMDFNL